VARKAGVHVHRCPHAGTPFGGGILKPFGRQRIIHDCGERGLAFRKRHRAHNVVAASGLAREQDAGYARIRHKFAFGDRGTGDADGTLGELAFCNFGALMHF